MTNHCQVASLRTHLPDVIDEANVTHPSPIYHDIVQGIHRRLNQISL